MENSRTFQKQLCLRRKFWVTHVLSTKLLTLVTFVMGFKGWVDPWVAYFLNEVLTFTSGAKPDLLTASITAKPFWIHVLVHVYISKTTYFYLFCTVLFQEKDMAFAGLTITSQRETAVDFSVPFWYETSSVAVHVSLLSVWIKWSS